MIASDLTRAVLALALILTRSPFQIYGIFLALSTVSSFFFPAQSVTLRTIVPKDGLLAANALMMQALQVMRIFSPALAGALVTWFGEKSCFYLDSFSFLFSALMIAGIRIDRQAAPGAQTVRSILTDLTSGIKFIFTHSAISFVMISMTAGTFAISCFSALVAVYVRDVLSSTSVLFGIVSSLVGVGMIAGTQVLSKFARNRSKNHLVTGGLLGNGVAIFLLAAVPNVAVTCLATFVLGFSVAFIIVPAQTLLQQETSVEMLGRVSGSLTSAITFAQLMALAFAGSIANLIGIRNLYYLSAAMLLGIAVTGYWRLRRVGAEVGRG